MSDYFLHIAILTVGELAALLIFWLIVSIFKKKLTPGAVLRGLLERVFLYICLINDIPQGLTFFGALKIATRIQDHNKISNDYFLTGNIVSVLIVISYYLLRTTYF